MEIKLEKVGAGFTDEYLKDIDLYFSNNEWCF